MGLWGEPGFKEVFFFGLWGEPGFKPLLVGLFVGESDHQVSGTAGANWTLLSG